MNKVSALAVLSNAVLVWNTVRMTEILRALETRSCTTASSTPTPTAAALEHRSI